MVCIPDPDRLQRLFAAILIGARDMAMPRLNAFTYWAFLFSGLFLYAGLAMGTAPNAGWFNYVPLASRAYNPGLNIDFYALANIFLGISTTLGSLNFVVTIFACGLPACRSIVCRS